jgi:hypothetical protein
MSMECIWKYALHDRECMILMPQDARVLTVQMQGETLCLWARVAPQAPQEPRYFVVLPTGLFAEDIAQQAYLGTVQQRGSVWHVFEAPLR